MPQTFRGSFGRVDVADATAHYFHVRPDGAPVLIPYADGGYPLVYVDERAGDYLCARCATEEMLLGCGAFSWGADRFAACAWKQRGTPARCQPVFRLWSRALTQDTPRRLKRWGRAVLSLALLPHVHYEGEALTCDNCQRRIRSAYGPLANIRRDKRIGRHAQRERPRRWSRILHASTDRWYPRATATF